VRGGKWVVPLPVSAEAEDKESSIPWIPQLGKKAMKEREGATNGMGLGRSNDRKGGRHMLNTMNALTAQRGKKVSKEKELRGREEGCVFAAREKKWGR